MRSNYYIETSTSSVTAWSTARIPFEPKDWLLEFRNRLKLAIAGLSPVDGRILYAAYRSPISKYADVENLLIYNISPAQLSNATRRGLVFERFYQMSRDCPVQLFSPALHQYEYLLVDDRFLSIEGQHDRPLASLSFELPARIPKSPASVWYAAKMGNIALTQRFHIAKPWGISIAIDSPSSHTIACSRIAKPLIDGITSALHCHDGSNIDYVSRQLGKNLGLRDGTLTKSLLEGSTNALFGRTDLLCRHGDNLQWNPKDDYCTYCSIECLYSLPVKSLKINCRIFDINQHEAT